MPAAIDHEGSNFSLEIALEPKLLHSYFLTKEINNYKLMISIILKCSYCSLTDSRKNINQL